MENNANIHQVETVESAEAQVESAEAQVELDAASVESAYTHTIAMTLGYRGTDFSGFARQKETHVRTVQGELEDALKLLYKRDVKTVCAGRTDAGVHAREQVITYDVTEEEFEHRTANTLHRSMNALVDDAISISRVEERPFGFSARFDAQWREYHYHINTDYARPVLIDPLCWHLAGVKLDLAAMNLAAQYLVGEHDFKSFCMAASAKDKSTMRNVMELEVYPEEICGYSVITIRIVGNAFLHSMVRTITGTLVEVGRGHRDQSWVKEVLDACDRSAAGQNAPAKGLTFWHVEY